MSHLQRQCTTVHSLKVVHNLLQGGSRSGKPKEKSFNVIQLAPIARLEVSEAVRFSMEGIREDRGDLEAEGVERGLVVTMVTIGSDQLPQSTLLGPVGQPLLGNCMTISW